mmetsp:Transcript_7850/g.18308  ORF Transcript_7850/g.18308 Transcript_7850/m.18308 type:complete len:994 (-) Transcript_7850:110-3091(-)
MAGPAVAKNSGIPCCTICLVIAALTCHSLVLVGNLRIAELIHTMGDSVHGWSGRGLVLASSLSTDVDHVMSRITDGLTNATQVILEIQSTVDEVIANMGDRMDDESFLIEMLEADRQCKEEVEDKLSSANMLQTVVQVMKGGDLQPVDKRSDVPPEIAPDILVSRANVAREATRCTHWRNYEVKLPSSGQSVSGDAVRRVVKREVENLHVLIAQFMTYLRPVLEQIGKWLVSFGDKLQSVLESLSTTIDKVQKMFDDIAAAAGGGGDEEQMVYDTITILNTDGDGNISVTDLVNASSFYGIECLQQKNAERMMEAHDKDGDGELNEAEYRTFVRDDAVPDVMGVALREYSKRLSAISGTVAAAKLRDEVAHAVVDYFSLVCAKNMSKVQWVSDRLTNGSLPLAFTSDILKELAQNQGNPNIRTTADVGYVIIKEMMSLNEPYVLAAFQQMTEPEFWASEGFAMADQPEAVQRVTDWIQRIQAEHGLGLSLIQHIEDSIESHATHPFLLRVQGHALTVRAAAWVKARGRARANAKVAKRAKRRQELLRTRTGRLLFARLIREPQSSDVDADLERIINAGVPAVPETLEFAQFLAWNASSTANRFQKQSADYMSSSTNPLQSFSNDIRGMINKIVGFIESMERYSTPEGITHVEAVVQTFLENAVDDMTSVLVTHHGSRATSMMQASSNDTVGESAMLGVSQEDVLHGLPEDAVDSIRGAWENLNGLLTTLTSMMPTVVDNIVFARTQVGAVSEAITSIFGTMDDSMPALFYMAARYYKMGWTAYFTLFALLTVGLLVYGFWAAGFLGSAEKVDGYVPPQTFSARCAACFSCCGSCVRSCHDGYITCWALVITGEIVSLLLFIIAIVLSILAGVQYFIASGCSMVYLLGDNTVCGGILNVAGTFLSSFLGESSGPDVCVEEKLTSCGMMAEQMSAAVIFIVIGGFAAAIVTLELIVDAAVNHERAIWRKRILDETAYDSDEAAAGEADADTKKAD